MCFCTPSIRTPFCNDCNQAMFLRIKELEAERDFLHHKAECLNMERKSQDKELAALRQRIADAPVVGWQAQSGFCYPSKRFDSDEPLISKEDLQK